MLFFITFLRAVAACLITNAHYVGIYPTDIIANGGLIGDVIFFAVSGYCLYNVKGGFVRWYSKRVVRCYLPVILTTLVYMLFGFYSLSEHSFTWWYIYPTYYHFVASIIILYVPFFIIMKIDALKKRIPLIMAILFAVYLLIYLIFYDKSYYHIDTVREPMIRFLFMESMLLGAYFKQRGENALAGFKLKYLFGVIVSFIVYFASKILFQRNENLAYLQIFNQIFIFILLYFIFALFAGLENKLTNMPKWIKAVVSYLAKITLEIYVVQYVLIDLIRPHFSFPINWIVLTVSILLAATVVHYVCHYILKFVDFIVTKIKGSAKRSEV